MQSQTQMQQPGQPQFYDRIKQRQPRRRDIFLHAGKSFKLISGLMTDRRVVLWRKRVDPIAEPPRRHREHATELAAAEDADDRSGED